MNTVQCRKGQTIRYHLPRGGQAIGVVAGRETTGPFARAYGPRVRLESGADIGVADVIAVLSRAAVAALAKHGEATCREAYRMHAKDGEGASTVGQYLGMTTRQADAAIAAGAELDAPLAVMDGVEARAQAVRGLRNTYRALYRSMAAGGGVWNVHRVNETTLTILIAGAPGSEGLPIVVPHVNAMTEETAALRADQLLRGV